MYYMKQILFSVIFIYTLNLYSQHTAVDLTTEKSVITHALTFHLGTIPIPLGGKLGIGYQYKNLYFEGDYFGYNTFYAFISVIPFAVMSNSFSKASFSTNYLFRGKRHSNRSLLLGLSLVDVWDNNKSPANQDPLYGLHLYPQIGYHNAKLGQSIFNFSVKAGAFPLLPNGPNKARVIPIIDVTFGINLFTKKVQTGVLK